MSQYKLKKSRKGTRTHISQRISAIALIPLSIWLVISSIALTHFPRNAPEFIISPLNIGAAILFIITFLYHAAIGMKIIIEDYIHNTALKHFLVILLYFTCVISAVLGLCAALDIHLFFITTMLR